MNFSRSCVNIIGCGFAGIECALFLAGHGIKVHVFDERKEYLSHTLRESDFMHQREINEAMLRRELIMIGSPLVKAEQNLFIEGYPREDLPRRLLEYGKQLVKNHPNIGYFEACVHEINPREITIIATGPRTDDGMYRYLANNLGSMRCFKNMPIFPVLNNIDLTQLYQRPNDEYYYYPLSYEDYIIFINKIVKILNDRKRSGIFDIESNTIEDLVCKGKDCLKNYAMIPVAISEFHIKPYAVIKFKKTENGLRVEDFCSKFDMFEQLEILKSIKPLENAIMLKPADVQKTCYVNSKYVVNEFHQCTQNENLFFAGSILGINGYINCISSGLYTALNVNKYFNQDRMINMPNEMCMGLLAKNVVSGSSTKPYPFAGDYGVVKYNPTRDQEEEIIEAVNNSYRAFERYKEVYLNGKHV